MIIYKATNLITNKFYIGISKKPLNIRKNEHHSKAKTTSKSIFHQEIAKHGRENFEWEIIDDTAQDYDELRKLEEKYIKKMKPYYNMCSGGDRANGRSRPRETRDKIAKTRRTTQTSGSRRTKNIYYS